MPRKTDFDDRTRNKKECRKKGETDREKMMRRLKRYLARAQDMAFKLKWLHVLGAMDGVWEEITEERKKG